MAAVMLGVFAALCWSLHDLIARSYAARIGGFRMAALVMSAGGILLTALVVFDSTIWRASWAAIGSGLMLGLTYGFGVGGLFKAFSLGPISLVAPVTAGYPVLVLLWAVAQGLEPSLLQWAAALATILGAIIVARAGPPDGGINAVEPGKLGPLLFFCAVCIVGYAASIVLSQKAGVAVGEIESTWLSRFTALAVLIPFAAGETRPDALRPRHWGGVFVMGGLDVLGVSAVAASGHLPDKEFTAIGISAYGAIAVIMAMLVLKEKVSPGQWLGIAMIVGGIATISLAA